MLNFAIDYKKAIKAMTSERKNNLCQFELDEEEWAIAEELRDMLKVCDVTIDCYFVTSLAAAIVFIIRVLDLLLTISRFRKILKDATLFFSRGTPSLPTVLPAMDHIDSMFTDYTLPTSKKHPAVRAAVEITKKTSTIH